MRRPLRYHSAYGMRPPTSFIAARSRMNWSGSGAAGSANAGTEYSPQWTKIPSLASSNQVRSAVTVISAPSSGNQARAAAGPARPTKVAVEVGILP